jgi:alpha-galactosidase
LKDPGKHHPAYDPKQGYEVAGFVWFQGYNDMIATTVYPHRQKPRGYERYSWLLSQFIRSVRKELNVPKMPFVIGVFGQGGKLDKPSPFREGMAAPASYEEFKGTVAAVRTAPFWDTRMHEIKAKFDRVMNFKGDPGHPDAELYAKAKAYEAEARKTIRARPMAKEKLIQKGLEAVVYTPEERAYLENNISNQGYHYYGAPKFFGRAGEAFARALAEMIKNR